jgi:drug/metabolite transporter (DMT)-like permease
MAGEWLIYAVASIVCWGLVNVLDSFFIGSKVYENMWDGMIVSSLYKILGVFLVGGIFFTKVMEISLANVVLSMLGGALISAAYMSCFAAMLYYNDAPLVQVVWVLSSPLVVVLGYFFLGEEFAPKAYVGMGVVFLGAFVVSFTKDSFKCKLEKFALLLVPMVVLYSASEVLMKYVEEVRNIDFGQSFPFVCLGQVLFGIVLLIIRRNPRHIGRIIKKNWKLFFSGEALELVGLFLMQLGIAKAPSIAMFGVVEAFMPVMVIALTCIIVFFLRIFERSKMLKKIYENMLSDIPLTRLVVFCLNIFERSQILKKIYTENMLSGLPFKVIATAIMMIGVYVL